MLRRTKVSAPFSEKGSPAALREPGTWVKWWQIKFCVDKFKIINIRRNKSNYSCTLMDFKRTVTTRVRDLSIPMDSSTKAFTQSTEMGNLANWLHCKWDRETRNHHEHCYTKPVTAPQPWPEHKFCQLVSGRKLLEDEEKWKVTTIPFGEKMNEGGGWGNEGSP